jgi:hypothetical protein
MTVSAQSPVITYTANGSATDFAYPFLVILPTDLKVYFNNIEVTTGFVVSGTGVEAGGTVTFTSPPANGTLIKLLRSLSLDRTTDYVEGGALRAAVLDADIDRVVMMLQDVRADSASLVEFAALLDETRENIDNIEANAAAAAASAAAALVSENNAAASEAGAAEASAIAAEGRVPRTSNTGSAVMPVGTTAQRDAVPVSGYTRFNTTLQSLEVYNDAALAWVPAGQGATGAVGNPVFYENDKTVTGDYTIASGKNAGSFGPITINTGVTVTVSNGATWSIV